ncbi:MAG: rod shape-determining protein MreC [Clostridium sp.]|jgi:rod shape-determining protein MreC
MMKNSKYILAGLSAFCILLIAATSINSGFLKPLRTGVGYMLVPLQSGVNAVGTGLYNAIQNYSSLKEAQAQNESLGNRLDQLVEENNRLQAEVYELSRLRELYQLDQEYMQYPKVAARVIAKDSGNWFHVFRIDKGSADGIEADMNVMADGGLVGIVTDVGANYATVRSIIDDDSNVSGMSMRTGDTCNVAGNLTLYQEGRLNLDHIKKEADIQDGDKIVTSNISDIFLPGILIGYASELTTDANNVTKSGTIIPAANFDNLQEVLVITQLKSGEEEDAENSD